uniref:Gins51 C-terminal domain-containing protein n=1 Tax=Candidatus Methanomethylicus mesodigestus TaxID=1867258 RepID=A0A7C3IWH1_9CREN
MYKKIMEFWTSEREASGLVKPPPAFEEDVANYLSSLEGGPGNYATLRAAEAARVRRMVEELRLIRKAKICEALVSGGLNEDLLMPTEGGAIPAKKDAPAAGASEPTKRILTRLLRDVPSFVGVDLKTYGPYKSEDVVLLPAQNAEALIKRGLATEIRKG